MIEIDKPSGGISAEEGHSYVTPEASYKGTRRHSQQNMNIDTHRH